MFRKKGDQNGNEGNTYWSKLGHPIALVALRMDPSGKGRQGLVNLLVHGLGMDLLEVMEEGSDTENRVLAFRIGQERGAVLEFNLRTRNDQYKLCRE